MLTGVLLGYLAVLVVLGAVLPGRTIAGTVLADKTRLYYKCNGDNTEDLPFTMLTGEEYMCISLLANCSKLHMTTSWEHGIDMSLVITGSGLASLVVLIGGLCVGIKYGYFSATVLLSSIRHLVYSVPWL